MREGEGWEGGGREGGVSEERGREGGRVRGIRARGWEEEEGRGRGEFQKALDLAGISVSD